MGLPCAQAASLNGWRMGCPNCELDIDEAHIRVTSKCVHDLLKGLLVNCPSGCKMIVRAENFKDHVESKCKDHYQSSVGSPSRVTAKEMMYDFKFFKLLLALSFSHDVTGIVHYR